jgi:hypothetical protein
MPLFMEMLGNCMMISLMLASSSMDQLEETFLKIRGIKLEDIQILLKILEYIKQIKNDTIKEFQDRFENFLWKIPKIHCPEDRYLIYLYTNSLLVHLGFLLSKKGPKIVHEAHNMDLEIEENISLSKGGHLFTLDTLSLERLVSPDIFEGREHGIKQHEVEERNPNEGFQSHEEGKEFAHASTEDNEDMVEERDIEYIKHDDEVLMCDPSATEAIHEHIPPTQEEEDEVSRFPFQVFDETILL